MARPGRGTAGPQGSGWQAAAAVAREAWPHGDLNKGQAPSDSETNAERHRPMIYMTIIGYKNLLSGYKQESGAVGGRASVSSGSGPLQPARRCAPPGTAPGGVPLPPLPARHSAARTGCRRSPAALFSPGLTLGRVCFGELPPIKSFAVLPILPGSRRRGTPARLAPARTYPGCCAGAAPVSSSTRRGRGAAHRGTAARGRRWRRRWRR